jgi:hypothetical protein
MGKAAVAASASASASEELAVAVETGTWRRRKQRRCNSTTTSSKEGARVDKDDDIHGDGGDDGDDKNVEDSTRICQKNEKNLTTNKKTSADGGGLASSGANGGVKGHSSEGGVNDQSTSTAIPFGKNVIGKMDMEMDNGLSMSEQLWVDTVYVNQHGMNKTIMISPSPSVVPFSVYVHTAKQCHAA